MLNKRFWLWQMQHSNPSKILFVKTEDFPTQTLCVTPDTEQTFKQSPLISDLWLLANTVTHNLHLNGNHNKDYTRKSWKESNFTF